MSIIYKRNENGLFTKIKVNENGLRIKLRQDVNLLGTDELQQKAKKADKNEKGVVGKTFDKAKKLVGQDLTKKFTNFFQNLFKGQIDIEPEQIKGLSAIEKFEAKKDKSIEELVINLSYKDENFLPNTKMLKEKLQAILETMTKDNEEWNGIDIEEVKKQTKNQNKFVNSMRLGFAVTLVGEFDQTEGKEFKSSEGVDLNVFINFKAKGKNIIFGPDLITIFQEVMGLDKTPQVINDGKTLVVYSKKIENLNEITNPKSPTMADAKNVVTSFFKKVTKQTGFFG